MTTKKKKKTKHRHRWETGMDSCLACGAYETTCKGCSVIGLFDARGKLLDIAE